MGTRRRRYPGPGQAYATVRGRLRVERGPASGQVCAECGAAAVGWVYDGSDPRELTDPRTGRRYSADLRKYRTLCGGCGRRADWAGRRRGRAPLDVARVAELYADGCSAAGIGRQFGYAASDVITILREQNVPLRSPGQPKHQSRASHLQQPMHQDP